MNELTRAFKIQYEACCKITVLEKVKKNKLTRFDICEKMYQENDKKFLKLSGLKNKILESNISDQCKEEYLLAYKKRLITKKEIVDNYKHNLNEQETIIFLDDVTFSIDWVQNQLQDLYRLDPLQKEIHEKIDSKLFPNVNTVFFAKIIEKTLSQDFLDSTLPKLIDGPGLLKNN
jgi:hypothetical protein